MNPLRDAETALVEGIRKVRHAAAVADEEINGGIDPADFDLLAECLTELAEARVALRTALSNLREAMGRTGPGLDDPDRAPAQEPQ